jgi:chemosensory pili system protein ChpC
MARGERGRRQAARKKVLRTRGRSRELHCMIVPTDPEALMLPTSVMMEVIDYSAPEPIEAAPPWLLGQVEWENRSVPVFSFSSLINGEKPGALPDRPHIMILKSLSDSARVPYLGVLLSGLPRPVTVYEDDVHETGDDKRAMGVFSRIRCGEDEAIVPDLDRLTHLVTHAAFGALPITQLDD